jgi:hypothetical protein
MTVFAWLLVGIGAVGVYGGVVRFTRTIRQGAPGPTPTVADLPLHVLPGWLVACAGVAVLRGIGVGLLLVPAGLVGWAVVGWVLGGTARRR